MNFMMNIKTTTASLHSSVETSGFIKRLIDGNATKEGYSEYLFNLSAMYKAIENALEKYSDNEIIKVLSPKELYRSKLIEKDLNFLLGDKLSSMELLPSTKAFVSRIKELEERQPELIAAHAYTRFLADLFGGRLFFKILTEKYQISPEGLNYYLFDKLDDPKDFVMNYHTKLNTINLSDKIKDDFINEINNNYIYNLAISNELEAKLYIK